MQRFSNSFWVYKFENFNLHNVKCQSNVLRRPGCTVKSLHYLKHSNRNFCGIPPDIVLEGFQGRRVIIANPGFEMSPQKNLQGAKSGKRTAQFKSPLKKIRRQKNLALKNSMTIPAVWAVGPSCLNQTPSSSDSSHSDKKSWIMVM